MKKIIFYLGGLFMVLVICFWTSNDDIHILADSKTEHRSASDIIQDAKDYFVANRESFEQLYAVLAENYDVSDYDELKNVITSYQSQIEEKDFWIYIYPDDIRKVLENCGTDDICNWYAGQENLGTININYQDGHMQWISISYYDRGDISVGIWFDRILDENYDVKQRLFQYGELDDGCYILYEFGV